MINCVCVHCIHIFPNSKSSNNNSFKKMMKCVIDNI